MQTNQSTLKERKEKKRKTAKPFDDISTCKTTQSYFSQPNSKHRNHTT